jgi:hypothetical protein
LAVSVAAVPPPLGAAAGSDVRGRRHWYWSRPHPLLWVELSMAGKKIVA